MDHEVLYERSCSTKGAAQTLNMNFLNGNLKDLNLSDTGLISNFSEKITILLKIRCSSLNGNDKQNMLMIIEKSCLDTDQK